MLNYPGRLNEGNDPPRSSGAPLVVAEVGMIELVTLVVIACTRPIVQRLYPCTRNPLVRMQGHDGS